MDNPQNQEQPRQEEKNHQEDIMKRYNALVTRWYNAPPSTKTILKLLPIFIILAAIPLTVNLTQKQQGLSTNAQTNNSIQYTPTPTITPSPKPTATITPLLKPKLSPASKY
jgi:hypothetical protein